MAMPVSLRKADDPMGGNKFAGAYFAAPLDVADPAERNAVAAAAQAFSVESASDLSAVLEDLLSLPVIAAGIGVVAVATGLLIHQKSPLSPWLLLGLVPGLVGAWLTFS